MGSTLGVGVAGWLVGGGGNEGRGVVFGAAIVVASDPAVAVTNTAG